MQRYCTVLDPVSCNAAKLVPRRVATNSTVDNNPTNKTAKNVAETS